MMLAKFLCTALTVIVVTCVVITQGNSDDVHPTGPNQFENPGNGMGSRFDTGFKTYFSPLIKDIIKTFGCEKIKVRKEFCYPVGEPAPTWVELRERNPSVYKTHQQKAAITKRQIPDNKETHVKKRHSWPITWASHQNDPQIDVRQFYDDRNIVPVPKRQTNTSKPITWASHQNDPQLDTRQLHDNSPQQSPFWTITWTNRQNVPTVDSHQ